MQQFELNAESRSDVGKGASRRLRRAGKVPAIVYGAGAGATALAIDHDQLRNQSAKEAFFSHILTLNIGSGVEKVVVKDMQRHPFHPAIMHVDFLRISEDEELTMRVPLHFANTEKCPGVKQGGGVVSHIITELEISCLPRHLPEYIEVDLIELELGDTVHLSDLKLPEGVSIYALRHGGDDSQPVVSVHLPRVEEEPVAEAEVPAGAVAEAKPAAEGEPGGSQG
jgi:large subunit ribosomal protein L25